jgi:hypothetical protein
MRQFLKNHWYGRHHTLFSVLFTLITLRFAVFQGYAWLPGTLSWPGLAVCVTVDGVFLLWQVTGTVRAADAGLKSGGNTMLYWACFTAVVIAVLSLAVSTTQVAFRITGTNPVPEQAVQDFTVTDGVVTISGEIDHLTYASFEILVEQMGGQLHEVRLDSDGGNIHAARGVARLIMVYRYDTRVERRCASACTLLFVAGAVRRAAPAAQLGFHGYVETGFALNDILAEQDKDRAFFRARGISDAFIEQMFKAPHSDIWFPGHAMLRAAGVITP